MRPPSQTDLLFKGIYQSQNYLLMNSFLSKQVHFSDIIKKQTDELVNGEGIA